MKIIARILLVLVLGTTVTCLINSRSVKHHYSHTDSMCVVPGMEDSVGMWEVEAARRFPGAFVYAAHGGVAAHSWICQGMADPTKLAEADFVHDLALRLKAQYPDRIIVLIICNPGHFKLHVPGVYYALADVWLVPDRFEDDTVSKYTMMPDAVGNIYEFVDD